MKTKRTIFIIGCIGVVLSLSAQPGSKRVNRQPYVSAETIESQRIGFITQRLMLTTTEAEKFWPVYNEFRKEKNKIRQQMRELMINGAMKSDQLSEAELKKIAETYIELEKKDAALIESYYPKFSAVLPIDKVVKLYGAEQQFKKELMEQMRSR